MAGDKSFAFDAGEGAAFSNFKDLAGGWLDHPVRDEVRSVEAMRRFR